MRKTVSKRPLHEVLTSRGYCTDRKEAESLIMAGRVIAEGNRIDKPGQKVPENAQIRLKGRLKYVGRGGFKLEGAISDFRVDLTGKTVLDAGASTGGFTDCLLQHGASKVFCVDAGYGTLAGKLRSDPRVVNLERTNISDLDSAHLHPTPSLATVDLSYISLRKAIPIIAPLLVPDGEMICLVKPLFEVSDPKARRSGKISEPSAYAEVLFDLRKSVLDLGLKVTDLTHSHRTGSKGTREFFLRIAKDSKAPVGDIDIERTVASALSLSTGDRRT